MNYKLYPNMKRMTTAFCIGIFCVTLSVLTLRLTVFSDVAEKPEQSASNLLSSEKDEYRINGKIYFSSSTSKGDVFITNLSTENLIRVDITLEDTGESILYTGFINPGDSLNSTTMNPVGQQLENGVYACVAQVSAYSQDDIKTVIGSAEMQVEVYIGEKPGK